MSAASNTPTSRLHDFVDGCDQTTGKSYLRELERLMAQNKRLLIDNLEYAITLAESDPLYLEVLRPQFKRIQEALHA